MKIEDVDAEEKEREKIGENRVNRLQRRFAMNILDGGAGLPVRIPAALLGGQA